jgi:Fe-S-cluster-containing hydrogenase component 2
MSGESTQTIERSLAVKVVVDTEECVGCETCVPECPAEAISMVDDKTHIDQEKCVLSQSCVEVCPVDAIKVEE